MNGFRTIVVGTDTLENLKVLKTKRGLTSYGKVVDYLIKGERKWNRRNKLQTGMRK